MKKLTLAAVAIASICASRAEIYEVIDERELPLVSGDTVKAAATPAVPDTLPDVGLTPIFRFDCTQTNNWTFRAGANSIQRLPSLVGNRYLISNNGSYIHDLSVRDPNNDLWNGADYWQLMEPDFAVDATLGKPVVDFGAQGSRKAFLFDYEYDNPDAFQKTNQLAHIGTVVAVWHSAAGGGTILGGGLGDNDGSVCNGNMWVRGNPFSEATQRRHSYAFATNVQHRSPLIWYPGMLNYTSGSYPLKAALSGLARLDGMSVAPGTAGFNGGWQVVSMVPTNALGVANGLGLGVVKQNTPELSGGMKIAEIIIYGERLDDSNLAKVENYLAKKWLSRTSVGSDGATRLEIAKASSDIGRAGVTNYFSAAAGESLTIGSAAFGRGFGARLVKTGAGTVEFGDLRHYAGTLEVTGGTCAFALKATPAAFPVKPCFHIDASDAASMTTYAANGTNFVARIESQSDDRFHGHTLCGISNVTEAIVTPMPFLRPDMFPDVNGVSAPVLDFHDIVGNGSGLTADKTGAMLRIAAADTETETKLTLENISTLVAVVAPRTKGGFLVGNTSSCAADPSSVSSTGCYFDRGQNDSSCWSTYWKPLLGTQPFTRVHPTLTPTNGLVMIDGVTRTPLSGYVTRDFQVLALRVPGSFLNAVGGTFSAHFAGGFMLAELALWDRPLTETEMRDASAYLSAKWFKRTIPGYTPPPDQSGIADVQSLEVTAETTLAIPSNATLRVGALTASAPLHLSGGGTLALTAGPAVTSAAEVAKGASAHFDACDTNLVEFDVSSRVVKLWYDKCHRNAALALGDPHYIPGDTSPAGLPSVNCGIFRSNQGLKFFKSLHSVQSVFVVAAANTTSYSVGGLLLGSSETALHVSETNNFKYVDFPYGNDSNGFPNGPFRSWDSGGAVASANGVGIEYYINGASTTKAALYPTDGTTFQLYEVHLPAGAHVSGFCTQAGAGNTNYLFSGGLRIAEVILYERPLSGREKVATRNYLMQKWLGATEMQPLPDEETTVCALAGLSGSGTLVADAVTASKLRVDMSSEEFPSIDGAFTIVAGMEIELANFGSRKGDFFQPILGCGSVAGLEHAASCVFTGDKSWEDRYSVSAPAYVNGVLGVTFRRRSGLLFICR